MEVVNAKDAVLYGFKQITTALLVILVGIFFSLMGILSLLESPGLGFVLSMIGFGILAAGAAGLQYKVISDAVATGKARSENRMNTAQKQVRKVSKDPQGEKVETKGEGE